MILKPDTQIFGEAAFSIDVIRGWIEENIDDGIKVVLRDFTACPVCKVKTCSKIPIDAQA